MAKINQKINNQKKSKASDSTKVKTVQLKSTPGKATKKTKRQNKTSTLLNKLKTNQEVKEKIRKSKQTQKAIIGSVNPLLDALADIDVSTLKDSERKKVPSGGDKQPKGKKMHPSEKKRINADLKDINLFKKVTEHEKFVACPKTAIKDHIIHMLAMEME